MGLDELVQVHAEQLSRYAKMSTEVEALREINHAVLVVRILMFLSKASKAKFSPNLPIHATSAECLPQSELADGTAFYYE